MSLEPRRLIPLARGIAGDARRAAWLGLVDFYRSDDLTYASSIAYYALLSLFPFLLLAASLLGRASTSPTDRGAVLEFVFLYFPGQFEFVRTQLLALREASWSLGLAGTVLTVWAALGVFGAVTTAVNHAWGVERQPNYVKHKLVSFVMLAAAAVVMLAGLFLVSLYGLARASALADAVGRTPWLVSVGEVVWNWAATVIFVVVVGLVLYFVPNTRVRFRDVWVGALATGLLWKAAFTAFSWYVTDLSRFSVHGSIAAVIVFLWWVFVSAVVFIYGVECTAEYARLRARRYGEYGAPARHLPEEPED
jgi:membrane protein